jgi:hypothetical protein
MSLLKDEVGPSLKAVLDSLNSDPDFVSARRTLFNTVYQDKPAFPKLPVVSPFADGVHPVIGKSFRRKTFADMPVITSLNVDVAKSMTANMDELLKKWLETQPDILGTGRLGMDYRDRFSAAAYGRRPSGYFTVDTAPTDELSITEFLERVRQTIGQTLHECAHPSQDAKADDIQRRLAQALRLMWWHETLENASFDLDMRAHDHTLRVVREAATRRRTPAAGLRKPNPACVRRTRTRQTAGARASRRA